MLVARFNCQDEARFGVVDETNGSIIDVGAAGLNPVGDELDLARLKNLVAVSTKSVRPDEITLLPPLLQPVGNLLAIGWNYREHASEGRRAKPPNLSTPTIFTKSTGTIIGPMSKIRDHAAITSQLDWEAELAVVIGRGGSDIDSSDAFDHIVGYTVANDISARDLQSSHGGQWYKGKSLDQTCPLGPYLLLNSPDVDPGILDISCSVNSAVMQEDNTSAMIFSIAELIAVISQGMRLSAGDVILTGTPAGVGHHREPPVFLRPGDVVETTISSIGTMRNRVGV